jgi:two-component system, OmpR family, phosphate regulon sensor histidine kinase PhoR
MKNPADKSLLFFYLMVGYVVLQFIWWGVLLFNLNNEVYALKSTINLLQYQNPALVIEKGNELEQKLHLKWMMVVGEGMVFLLLLSLGVMRVVRTHKKEAELAARQQNFLLSVTHELKSPIAGIKIAAETLLKRDLEKNKQHEILSNALSDTDRLNQLVENILTSAKIDEGKFHFIFKPLNVSELLADICRHYGRRVSATIQPNVNIVADAMAFPSIVHNLIDNALCR